MQRTIGLVSLLAVVMVLAAPSIEAQTNLIVNVPFSFSVGQRTMTAGNYAVRSVSQQIEQIRSMDTGVAQLLIKQQRVQSMKVEHARLVFHKYGNTYFLSQIWDGNSDTGIQLSKSAREKELSLAAARWLQTPQTVIVAMK